VNKSSLLSQLQINRDEEPRRRRSEGSLAWLWWTLAVLAAALVAGALIWFLIARPDRLAVHTAEAKAIASGGAAQGGSLLDASGYVVARRQATVSSKIGGRVVELNIEEGDHVTAGQLVARLDDTNARAALEQARAQVAAAEANVDVAQIAFVNAGPKYQRNVRLHATGDLSDQAVEDAKAAFDTARFNLELARRQVSTTKAGLEVAQRSLDDTVVRAPFAGVITVKAAQPGEIVSPVSAGGGFTRTGIGTIVDMDSLEVQVDVAESFIGRVHPAMPATVKLNAYPDWDIPAEVIAVVPTADRSKATVGVRVGFKIKDPRIVPEMGAHVSFLSPPPVGAAAAPSARSVVVPVDAVQNNGPELGEVFVINNGTVERRAVRLGMHRNEGQVLTAGVSAGEAVAVGGLDKLHDGQKVRLTTKPQDD
jgi:RND family efflux transporter MFP subunit